MGVTDNKSAGKVYKHPGRTVDMLKGLDEIAIVFLISVFWLILGMRFRLEFHIAGACALLLLLGLIIRTRYGKNINNHSQKMRYEGDIDNLTEKLIFEIGAEVRKQVGNFYQFKTGFKLLPDMKLWVQDCGSYCIISLNKSSDFDNRIISLLSLKVDQPTLK